MYLESLCRVKEGVNNKTINMGVKFYSNLIKVQVRHHKDLPARQPLGTTNEKRKFLCSQKLEPISHRVDGGREEASMMSSETAVHLFESSKRRSTSPLASSLVIASSYLKMICFLVSPKKEIKDKRLLN